MFVNVTHTDVRRRQPTCSSSTGAHTRAYARRSDVTVRRSAAAALAVGARAPLGEDVALYRAQRSDAPDDSANVMDTVAITAVVKGTLHSRRLWKRTDGWRIARSTVLLSRSTAHSASPCRPLLAAPHCAAIIALYHNTGFYSRSPSPVPLA